MKNIFSKTKRKEEENALKNEENHVLSHAPADVSPTSLAHVLKESAEQQGSSFTFNFFDAKASGDAISNDPSEKDKKKKKRKKKKKSAAEGQKNDGSEDEEENEVVDESQKKLVETMTNLALEPVSKIECTTKVELAPTIAQGNQEKKTKGKQKEKVQEKKEKLPEPEKKSNGSTNQKKGTNKKVTKKEEDDDDLAFLDSVIADQKKEFQEQQKVLKKQAKANPSSVKGPKFISSNDPNLNSNEKLLRKFGKGKNLVSVGPAKVKDPNWLGDDLNTSREIPPVSLMEDEKKVIRPPVPQPPSLQAQPQQQPEKVVYHHSPFTFSFSGL